MSYNNQGFKVVKDFEQAICEYTGAPYCVTVNSCTSALFLALKYSGMFAEDITITIPKRTYVSVPMQIIHAGYGVAFEDLEWSGMYRLKPFCIWDSARRFTKNMWLKPEILNGNNRPYVCVSFHWSKTLGLQQGGAILHSDYHFDEWARRARFDGRTEGVAPSQDRFEHLGWHLYLSPEIAAQGLVRLQFLPRDNPDLPNDDYPDLSTIELFK